MGDTMERNLGVHGCPGLHNVTHRAGCSEAGVLGRRGFRLERAAAQVCREAGGRVSSNVLVREMDLAVVNQLVRQPQAGSGGGRTHFVERIAVGD